MRGYYIGTSGFSYSSWKNFFYPPDLPSKQWFEFYCSVFNTVELNSTFYRFPRSESLKKFYARAPADFIFAVKAHKVITHTMRLKKAREKVNEFLAIVHGSLQEKTGPILFQLPPSYKYDEENINNVLESIPGIQQHVIEFRHNSWWDDQVIKKLRSHHLTFCNVSFPGLPESFHKTTQTFYLRMHGVPRLFESSYSTQKLKEVEENIPASAKNKFIYFNNTSLKAGYTNALKLIQLAH